MGLTFIIFTLRSLKIAINLTAINKTLKQFFTRIDRFLLSFKVRISVGGEFRVHPLIAYYFHGIAQSH